MGKYVLKRLGYLLFVFLIISILMFMIYRLVPANRAYTDAKTDYQQWVKLNSSKSTAEKEAYFDALYKEYQLDYGTDTKNLVVLYLRWMGLYPNGKGVFNGLFQGNFGYSYENKKPVLEAVKDPMLQTIKLNFWATICTLAITIPLGIYCAIRKGKKVDQTMQVVTIVGYSLPSFTIALVFIWIFCAKLRWLPPSGMSTPGNDYTGFQAFLDGLKYFTLPLTVSVFTGLGGMTRYVRASMIDAMSLDCVRTARAKGVKEKTVIYSHAWRNAMIPIVTLIVGWFLGMFAGSVMIESMFAYTGMGQMMITSLRTSDYDVTILVQLFYVVISLVGNLLLDIIYGLVDPRVRVNK